MTGESFVLFTPPASLLLDYAALMLESTLTSGWLLYHQHLVFAQTPHKSPSGRKMRLAFEDTM